MKELQTIYNMGECYVSFVKQPTFWKFRLAFLGSLSTDAVMMEIGAWVFSFSFNPRLFEALDLTPPFYTYSKESIPYAYHYEHRYSYTPNLLCKSLSGVCFWSSREDMLADFCFVMPFLDLYEPPGRHTTQKHIAQLRLSPSAAEITFVHKAELIF